MWGQQRQASVIPLPLQGPCPSLAGAIRRMSRDTRPLRLKLVAGSEMPGCLVFLTRALAIGRCRPGILARCGHVGCKASSAVALRNCLPLRGDGHDEPVCRYAPFSKTSRTLLHSQTAALRLYQLCGARDVSGPDTYPSATWTRKRPTVRN